MLKHCNFVGALMVCLCIFTYDTVSIYSDWGGGSFAWADNNVTFTISGTANCSESFLKALNAAKSGTASTNDLKIENIENITGLTFKDGKITADMSIGDSPFTADSVVPITDITDLTGIGLFTGLTALDVTGCTALTALDASACTNLTSINITGVPGIISTYQYDLGNVKKFLYPVKDGLTITSDPKFYAKQLVLTEGGLKMYFFMAPGSKAFTTGDKMEFTVGGNKRTDAEYNENVYLTNYITTSTGTYDYKQTSKYNEDPEVANYTAVKHYGFACDVTSIEMADDITATFLPYNGETQLKTTYSVEDYLDELIKQVNNIDSKTTKLAKAIQDYGHYVQKPLSALRGWTLGRDGGETKYDHQIMPNAESQINETTYLNITESESTNINGFKLTNTTGLEAGCALQLDSRITLIVYLPSTVTVAETGAISPVVDYSVNAEGYTEDGKTVVTIPNLNAKELNTKYTITFTSNGTSNTIEVYGLSYVYSVLNMTDAQKTALVTANEKLTNDNITQFVTNLQSAVIALYRYHIAEKAYN